MNGGPGNELGARRAEQFPRLGNYTLTPDDDVDVFAVLELSDSRQLRHIGRTSVQ